jgi:hypothetical protein
VEIGIETDGVAETEEEIYAPGICGLKDGVLLLLLWLVGL